MSKPTAYYTTVKVTGQWQEYGAYKWRVIINEWGIRHIVLYDSKNITIYFRKKVPALETVKQTINHSQTVHEVTMQIM